VSEMLFHHIILSIIGVAGFLEYYATYHLPKVWSKPKRVYLGITAGLTYLWQGMVAFNGLANASSLEILGFIGCILGCLGSVRMMCGEVIPPAPAQHYLAPRVGKTAP
jgi:hypothetical protein